MTNDKRYPVSDSAKQRAHLSIDQYQDLYQKSIQEPEAFWPEMANEFLTWSKPWEQLTETPASRPKSPIRTCIKRCASWRTF